MPRHVNRPTALRPAPPAVPPVARRGPCRPATVRGADRGGDLDGLRRYAQGDRQPPRAGHHAGGPPAGSAPDRCHRPPVHRHRGRHRPDQHRGRPGLARCPPRPARRLRQPGRRQRQRHRAGRRPRPAATARHRHGVASHLQGGARVAAPPDPRTLPVVGGTAAGSLVRRAAAWAGWRLLRTGDRLDRTGAQSHPGGRGKHAHRPHRASAGGLGAGPLYRRAGPRAPAAAGPGPGRRTAGSARARKAGTTARKSTGPGSRRSSSAIAR